MKKTYFMIVFENVDGLWCEFPDLPGCLTDGATLEELLRNAADALDSWMESAVEHGDALPDASSAAELQTALAAAGPEARFLAPVGGYLPSEPARINVTSTADKITEITDYAKRHKRTRSELMVSATLDLIRRNP